MRSWIMSFLWLVATVAPSLAQDDIWAAARAGDLPRVEALLASGVEVDVKTRYNATPLYFAAREGHLELVEFLLEKGSTVNDSEQFVGRTPLTVALGGGHERIAELLVEHGAVDTGYKILAQCVEHKFFDVAKAIVAQRPLLTFERDRALDMARRLSRDDFVALLEKAEVTGKLPVVELDAATMESRAGTYRAEDEKSVEITFADGVVTLLAEDAEPVTLVPLSARHFRAPSDHGVAVYFNGRLGAVEWIEVLRGTESLNFRPYFEETPVVATSAPSVAEREASPAPPRTAAVHWPSFRGPGASGVADGQGVPATWDIDSGKNVLWKIDIPGLAHASPVVWGERVFVTTAISAAGEPETSVDGGTFGVHKGDDGAEHTWRTLALDKATGEVVWQRDAGKAVPLTGRHLTSSQANATPATDGRHVVVIFPTAGMVCYDFAGKELWRKDFGGLNSANYTDADDHWGFASSPIIADGKVILQADVYEGAFLAAYDVATGRELWKAPRDEVASWSTPLYYEDKEHREIITNGPTIRGYDPRDGSLLWTLRPNSEQVMPTPIAGEGLIYVTTGYPPARPIYAVRPGHRGDLSLVGDATSSEAIAWSRPRGGSYMITPIVYRGIFYLPADGGRLTAYDAATGERIYRARLSAGGNFTASPVASDGRLYLPTGTGTVYVVKAGPTYEEIALIDMKEGLTASPAISDGALFIRTRSGLYALGATK